MRKWGLVVTAFYALIVVLVLVPGAYLVSGADSSSVGEFIKGVRATYAEWVLWILLGAVLGSQALLLFLSVDTTEKRLKPRSHVLVSCAAAGILTALLISAVVWSVGFAEGGDKVWDQIFDKDWQVFSFWGGLWLVWGVVFYLYLRNSSEAVTKAISWLLKGSVLELLIVVPCHIVVRRRHDCSAPIATSFGIATGIAVMLLCFGPSVLFLYKKRLDSYSNRASA
ncbi:MAG TPA: hypothetical protein VE077_11375 [Candidatus Methylomirabilis sp.]|nr:hypothetical protein [Candidatus Methylomirabilis sp.]